MDYNGKKICAVPDHLGGISCLWPFADVTVFVPPGASLGGVELSAATKLALDGWNKVCGINLQLTANPKTAHITITQGSIDGPAGTLAYSGLPCGFTIAQWQQILQKYDTGEMWTLAENPPDGKIDAVRVIAHEIGHAIGISHLGEGSLMAATYSKFYRWPQRDDIVQALARYPRRAVPPPVDPPVIPGVPAPGTDTDWTRLAGLIPCAIGALTDVYQELTPAERKALVKLGLDVVRMLTPAQIAEVQAIVQRR